MSERKLKEWNGGEAKEGKEKEEKFYLSQINRHKK